MAKFVRFAGAGVVRYGELVGDQVLGLTGSPMLGGVPDGSRYRLSDVTLLAPLVPGKIIGVGRNYKEHAAEFGNPPPERPILFIKPDTALNGPGGAIVYPPETGNLHFEGELVIVIGRTCRRVPPAEAAPYIFGYTCGNDVTARDLQRADGQWTRGKGFDTFCPLGPAIVTGLDGNNLGIQTTLNGEVRQHSHTSRFLFPVEEVVSFISMAITLNPGDVILTGTPEGVGPMQVGDVVRVTVEGIGTLENRVVAYRE